MSTLDQKTFDRNVKISTNVNDCWQASIKLSKGPAVSYAATPGQKTNIAKAEAKEGLQKVVSQMLAEHPEWSL